MSHVGKLAGVTLDTTNPSALADFYISFTGWRKTFDNDALIHISSADGASRLGFQRVTDHRKPDWPGAGKQLHLDFKVDDVDKAEEQLITLGASKPEFQPAPQKWRVLQDPAGHPFCISAMSG